jgi:phosphopantetheine--protein transferase-like protein
MNDNPPASAKSKALASRDGSAGEPRLYPAGSGKLVRVLLPETVTVVEGSITFATDDLWPQEAAQVINAVAKRRQEFAAGRRFSHHALEILGVPPSPLLVNHDRSPLWPSGIAGSITHTDRYCAVAAARKTKIAAIGIDVEAMTRLRPDILAYVLSPQEIATQLPEEDPRQQQKWGAIMFSAKEALYKCLCGLAPVQLGFRDCAIYLDRDNDAFRAELLRQGGCFAKGHRFSGRYGFSGDLVATAIALSPQDCTG